MRQSLEMGSYQRSSGSSSFKVRLDIRPSYLNLLYTTAMISITSTVMIAIVIIRFVAIL